MTTEQLQVTEACPGVEYFTSPNITQVTLQQVKNGSDCDKYLKEFSAISGVLYGTCEGFTIFCQLHVKMLPGRYARAHVHRSGYWCASAQWEAKMVHLSSSGYVFTNVDMKCSYHGFEDMVLDSNSNHLRMLYTNNPPIEVAIHLIKEHRLFIEWIQQSSGYVTVPFLFSTTFFKEEIKVPSRSAIMMSVKQLNYLPNDECSVEVDLVYDTSNSSHPVVSHLCVKSHVPASFFPTSSLEIQFQHEAYVHSGLKLQFLAIFEKDLPEKVDSGLYNCSGDNYPKFQPIVVCNFVPECDNGMDETEDCPFSSPGCEGLVASNNKCFMLVTLQTSSPVPLLSYDCQMRGGNLASIKSRKEQDDSLLVFQKYAQFNLLLGYYSGWVSDLFAYSKFQRWYDGTVIYNMNHFRVFKPYSPSRLIRSMYLGSMIFFDEGEIKSVVSDTVLCEVKAKSILFRPESISTSRFTLQFTLTNTLQVLTACPQNHVTHVFLTCDPDSHCGKATFSRFCALLNGSMKVNISEYSDQKVVSPIFSMFRCDDDFTTLHHSLVCDFRSDCVDNSDESFCDHPSCQGFLCANGQCVLASQRCNEYSDCLDDSDEALCSETQDLCAHCTQAHNAGALWFLINLDGTGYFTQKLITTESCPVTHYRCTSERLYCVPIYTRCNGLSDCVNGEDEQDCTPVTLPGFYKCRGSKVVVHEDHLCDGWSQCPQQDDELMCDMICPAGCLCQGHGFRCPYGFSADLFPQVRYVDATGSGMVLRDFNANAFLIYLSLSSCLLTNITSERLVNLQFLDLSNNFVRSLERDALPNLPSLQILLLSNNPLNKTFVKMLKQVHYSLRQLDLSKTQLRQLNSELLIYFPNADHLNVSFSFIESIKPIGFENMPRLTQLDIRGNIVYSFPVDLFSGLYHLRSIFSSSYRFCCENLFLKLPNKVNCLAPDTVFPTCTTLIPTEINRVFFWTVSGFALFGNLVCFIVTFTNKNMFGIQFVKIFGHLECAHACMGGHVAIVTIANEMLGEQYIRREQKWVNSAACKLSGFLFLMSSEVSIFAICFITLGHIIVLYFPVQLYRFSESSTMVASVVSWLFGIVMSLTLLLSGLSDTGFSTHSGLCRLAFHDHYNSQQELTWFTVMLTINFVFCLIILVGQILVYKRTPKYRAALDPARRWAHSSAHLLKYTALMHAVCWLSFCLATLLARHGVTAAAAFQSAMAVFVLPLTSAVCPFPCLGTFLSLLRGLAQEERLLQKLRSRLVGAGKNVGKINR